MWASIKPCPPLLTTPPFRRRHFPISAGNRRPPPQNSTVDEIGGLGLALLTTLAKTPITNNTPNPKQKQEKNEKQKQEISGSDVLWAINKANVQKKKKNGEKMKKKKNGEEESGSDDDDFEDEDYSKVRPLIIKNEWITRLDDLQKHLQDLSESSLVQI